MKDTQDCICQSGEVFVQKGRYPELFRHECLARMIGTSNAFDGVWHTLRVSRNPRQELIGESELTPQADKYFHCGFAGNGQHRQANAPEKAVKTREGNIKYNIGTDGDEGVTQHGPKGDSAAPFAALARGDPLSQ